MGTSTFGAIGGQVLQEANNSLWRTINEANSSKQDWQSAKNSAENETRKNATAMAAANSQAANNNFNAQLHTVVTNSSINFQKTKNINDAGKKLFEDLSR